MPIRAVTAPGFAPPRGYQDAVLFEGARDEDVFKTWTRDHQVRTELWFTAYEHLSVGNIRRNAKICEGLIKPPRDLDAWLALL